MKHLRILILLTLIFAGLAQVTAVRAAGAAPGTTQTQVQLSLLGTGILGGPAAIGNSNGNTATEVTQAPDADQGLIRRTPNTPNAPAVPALSIPTPDGMPIANSNPRFSGFNGLSHFDQRNAGTGIYANSQYSLEPPDQALCVSSNYVLESVNTALAVYNTSGTLLGGPTALNQFFSLQPEINRTTGVAGDFTSDPKCYYDAGTNRFFLTVLEEQYTAGQFNGNTFVLLAVSQTGNPTGAWTFYALNTTNDGSNGVTHPGCPCLPDQPLIGADKYGFYISTNEFPLTVNGFNGAQLYAIPKAPLAAGQLPAYVVLFNTGLIPTPDAGGTWYSVQPATTPPGGAYEQAQNGTEYFLSALQFFASPSLDNRIAAWALSGTKSLTTNHPNLNLQISVIQSEVYGQPPDATQKAGPTPLGTSLGDSLEKLAGNDDRMNQVVFADEKLWSGVNTVVGSRHSTVQRVGIAYFLVRPQWRGNNFRPIMDSQGYVAVDGANVLFPSIGVNKKGKGAMTFTLAGPDYYPSAAYVPINDESLVNKVHIAGPGAAPEDGFTGYPQYGGNGTARWGDYSAAVAGPDGSIWMAAEYIPNTPRTVLANWGTFISHLNMH